MTGLRFAPILERENRLGDCASSVKESRTTAMAEISTFFVAIIVLFLGEIYARVYFQVYHTD